MSRGKITIASALIGAVVQGMRGKNILEGALLGAGAGAGIVATSEVMRQLKTMQTQGRLPKSLDDLPHHDLEAVAEEVASSINAKNAYEQ